MFGFQRLGAATKKVVCWEVVLGGGVRRFASAERRRCVLICFFSDFTEETGDSPLKRVLSEKEAQTGVQSAGSPHKTTQEGQSPLP